MLSYDCIDNNINLENIISKWWFEKKMQYHTINVEIDIIHPTDFFLN